MTVEAFGGLTSRAARFLTIALVTAVLAGCSLFGPSKVKEEPIIPAATLYQKALDDMDRQYFQTAIKSLEQLDRQHPRDPLTEKSKLMQVFANYRANQLDEAILAADRYLAVYPNGKDAPYVMYLKGNSYFAQIKDITRDQQLSADAIETYQLLISNYPRSEYAKDAKEKLLIAYDQLAGKEMSVGRYYLGNGQYTAAINRFRVVVETWQTSTHIEEALYRLTEAYLSLGLTNEAMTAAAVLGHNYPSSSWYKEAFALLGKQGLAPAVNNGSWLAGLRN
ncbi:outer membrane protein assembly factor BamD [Devosia sp. J2-20]|uniref:outer membrane protein assembly factor BamD n=1 Tax=Devosia TaxID=46913 RepID=UPI0022AF8C5F|nr:MULTISPECIES: outer membrane protein assembly factor BamD [Devosia]MCZ4345786.1 outer membrane protein assembly factor BamD [Devosia neptuniae]WDQ99078.1 outer membrane protein assembly factor BamD [Devosia sp. J2-20]